MCTFWRSKQRVAGYYLKKLVKYHTRKYKHRIYSPMTNLWIRRQIQFIRNREKAVHRTYAVRIMAGTVNTDIGIIGCTVRKRTDSEHVSHPYLFFKLTNKRFMLVVFVPRFFVCNSKFFFIARPPCIIKMYK